MALNVRLTPEENEMLTQLAESGGASKQQTLVRLLREEWERDQAKRAAHAELDRIHFQRRDLMKRLKDA